MLYDNAQLARVYLHAYQITGNEFYKRITTEILDYVMREMTSPEGGFYSSQDADSEGHEGKFFVWTPEEVRSVLGGSTSGLLIVSKSKPGETNDAALFMDAYGVTEKGNFEGKNILHRMRDTDVLAEMHRLSPEEVERKLDDARQKLFAARERRVKPARDEKILTETMFDEKYWVAARALGDAMLKHFADPRGGFFDTSDDHEALVVRPKETCRSQWLRGQCNAIGERDGSDGAVQTVGVYGRRQLHGCGRKRASAVTTCAGASADRVCVVVVRVGFCIDAAEGSCHRWWRSFACGSG